MGTPTHSPHAGRSSSALDEVSREQIIALLRAHGVRRAGVFGSQSRGDARSDSDIDLLIEPPDDMSLFGFSALALALEDLLHRRVDLVTYASLHPRLRASVYAHYDELFADSDGSRRSDQRPEQVGR